MKFLLYTTLIASLFVSNIEAIWVPKQGTTWNYVLKGGEHINVSKETAQVVDLDFTHKSKISELHSKGIKAICYFSGGTLESFRDDKDQYYKVDGLIKTKYEEFSDEIWLDHRKEGLKPLIENRIKRAVSNGCDGLEIDNLGGYKHKEVQKWSDPLTEEDTVRFARWLAKTVHSYGLSIGLKNVLSIVDIVGDDFDYAINESCVVYNECKRYKNFLKKGKAVFGVTYDGVSSNQKGLCSNLNGLGISMIVKSGSSSDGLVQDGVIFDGKKYCGDSFNPGKY
ncbi:hypothetical protein BCR32DRAFT_199279 [Anaeromyces robustus]|uniref:alpha-galactosidase n=1 Tax=Anaeromyces robustus TaxID=1754192 RepID=A0A1Y1XK47_9FUNG|nr:hypothetical protein BCR32DRAFT_199279 [Anaeromyces robustus]|eukprot:ORX86131.1 hypothetical protein BCR32DRAFT_199279 [Anaeromyces robustus]